MAAARNTTIPSIPSGLSSRVAASIASSRAAATPACSIRSTAPIPPPPRRAQQHHDAAAALSLWNGAFALHMADAFAARVAIAAPDDREQQLTLAFRLAFQRDPVPAEAAPPPAGWWSSTASKRSAGGPLQHE